MSNTQHNDTQLCVCGKPLPLHVGKGRKKRFCSAACKQAQYRNRKVVKRNAKHTVVYLLNAVEQVPSLQSLLQSGGICQGEAYEVLKSFPDNCIDMVITSPPYWALRDYGIDGQLGLEETFEEYITKLCNIFDEVKRVLKASGTCWVNIGDTYSSGTRAKGGADITNFDPKYPQKNIAHFAPNRMGCGLPDKTLCLIPFRFAVEMVKRGWILRNTIVWHKPNVMPRSMKDRFTDDFEYLFFFVKSKKYYFEQQFEPLKEDSMRRHRNKRCVWSIPTKQCKEAHFAVYPHKLCETPIKAGCPPGGIVLDPFMGSGTTCIAASQLGRRYIGIELNNTYIHIAQKRLAQISLPLVS